MSVNTRYYVQCHLSRGTMIQVAWIPEVCATVGQAVRLKDHGDWEDGWRVTSAGARALEAYVHQHSHDHGRMRQATDI